MVKMIRWGYILGAVLLFANAQSAQTQKYSAERPIGFAAQQLPDYLKHAGVQQHLNHILPLDVAYTDETQTEAPLRHWLGKRPTIIALIYYRCTMLCPQVLHGLAKGLSEANLKAGADYQVITFSIDPEDTAKDAAAEKARFVSESALTSLGASSHFLTSNAAGIKAISDATGFGFVRVPGPDGQSNQFAHSSVIMFVTPDGRLSKYISGIDYPPRDLRLAVLAASEKRISNPVDLFLIYCCNYNPVVGRYSVAVLHIVSIAGAATILAVVALIWLLTRKPKGRAFA